MRTAMFSPLILGAVVFAALSEPAVLAAAESVRLTETQMDAVTAGTVAIGMGAFAVAGSPDAYTYTNTSTIVFSTPTPKTNVDIGLGFGKAYACCGPNTYTSVQAVYYAEGDKVIAHSTNIDTSTPQFSFSHGVTAVTNVG